MKQANTSILFTGDIGRLLDPVMKPPTMIDEADYLVMESTYGNRLHDVKNPLSALKNVINETIRRGGTVIIPAFAVGRAQSILWYIHLLKQAGDIPSIIPVFLDSPMAINATKILCSHQEEHQLSKKDCANLCKVATYVSTIEESKKLDAHRMPKIIISASGMVTGGRVLHHIKVYGPDPKSTILFTGFQAGGTRGDRMINGEHEIKIHGQFVPIRARIENITSTSAHADYQELLTWLSHFKKPPKKVFITHGEIEASLALKTKIEEKFGWHCVMPNYLQKETLE